MRAKRKNLLSSKTGELIKHGVLKGHPQKNELQKFIIIFLKQGAFDSYLLKKVSKFVYGGKENLIYPLYWNESRIIITCISLALASVGRYMYIYICFKRLVRKICKRIKRLYINSKSVYRESVGNTLNCKTDFEYTYQNHISL